ncbi:glycoside hydrolase family 32 protein [Microbacterium pumilum]|uniref:beta-fructofuranosidase n=1 Tax=Microbacterium pumilum TaxID=344165 RepID=A0ABP5DHT0_9MICO
MRPDFHFTPAAGWINDPHGLHHWKGEYHAFYQYVPERTEWSEDIHWGHAKGLDLLSLEELAVAIFPGDGDVGIWTGSLVVDDEDAAHIFYTSVSQPVLDHARIRIATPVDPDWATWRKGAFVAEMPAELTVYRDPWVFRDGAAWSMLVGGRHQDGGGAMVSYRSDDLRDWTYQGIALRTPTDGPLARNVLWECPQLFEIDGRHVLVLSVGDEGETPYVGYAIGEWADGRFDAASWGRLTFSRSHYAPTFVRDASGRPTLVFWLREVSDVAAGWAGALSVPYLLALDHGELVVRPHPDLGRFRLDAVAADAGAPAADIVWAAQSGAELSIATDAGDIVALRMTDDRLFVETASEASSMPAGGEVRIVLDGPIVEVSTERGVYGAQIPVSRGFRVTGDTGAVQVHPLARPAP